jgi:hypothetical protein
MKLIAKTCAPMLFPLAALACGGTDSATAGGGGAGTGTSSTEGAGAHHPMTSSQGTGTSTGPSTSHTTGTSTTSSTGAGGSAPSCTTEAWGTYGHDAQRTFASGGCVDGALTAAWHYVPTAPSGRSFEFETHAIATPDAAYLQWAATDSPYIGTTAIDKVSTAGARVWTWDSGTDSNLGNWASIALGFVVVNDDGMYYLNDADGTLAGSNGVDWWGQIVPDTDRLYLVNNEHVDGPGVFVGAMDATRTVLWQQNQFGACRIDAGDEQGGLALDGGVLFYAPLYSFGDGPMASFSSAVYAFDGATGAPKWTQPTSPVSAISAKDGRVYLVEQTSAGTPALTARSQSDGSVVWQTPIASAGGQAPVLANDAVIIAHDFDQIDAYDAATGVSRWSTMAAGSQGFQSPLMFSGGCVNGVGTLINPTTQLAAAVGSGTLIVAGSDAVHVLALADGTEHWSGVPANATAPFRDPVIVGSTVYMMDSTGLMQLEVQ